MSNVLRLLGVFLYTSPFPLSYPHSLISFSSHQTSFIGTSIFIILAVPFSSHETALFPPSYPLCISAFSIAYDLLGVIQSPLRNLVSFTPEGTLLYIVIVAFLFPFRYFSRAALIAFILSTWNFSSLRW